MILWEFIRFCSNSWYPIPRSDVFLTAILPVKPGPLCKYLVDPFLIRQPLVLVHVVKANRQKGTRLLGAESVHLEIAWKNVCFSVPVSRTKGCRWPQKGGSQTSQCRIHGHRWHGWTRVRGQLGTAALLALRNNDRPKRAMPRSHWGTNDPVGSWNPFNSSNWIHGIPLNLIESHAIPWRHSAQGTMSFFVIFLAGWLCVLASDLKVWSCLWLQGVSLILRHASWMTGGKKGGRTAI